MLDRLIFAALLIMVAAYVWLFFVLNAREPLPTVLYQELRHNPATGIPLDHLLAWTSTHRSSAGLFLIGLGAALLIRGITKHMRQHHRKGVRENTAL